MPYDQLDSMNEVRSILDDSVAIHKSRRPLRWIANWLGGIASRGLLDVSYMEDNGYTGWRYKVNLFLWDTFWPIYNKYGTFYVYDLDMEGPGWDDYNEDGVPYWEEFHWDFIDEETGDAFKVINYGK
jgi:hypothetical protein